MRRALHVVIALSLAAGAPAFCGETPTAAAAAGPAGIYIDHVTLGVASIDKEAEWYQRVLGFQLGAVVHRPAYDVQRMTLGNFFVNLLSQKDSTRPTPMMDYSKQGILSLSFGTSNAETQYQHLMSLGVVVQVSRDPQGKITSLHFNDPEGNGLEISQR